MNIVVMKFGGTSVCTSKGQAAIVARVGERIKQGLKPVLVVSAMGRSGDPYATDTLLDLVSHMPSSECEKDLLATTGEVISAVVIAHTLRNGGIKSRAFTGPSAGIITDEKFGKATITEICIDPLMSAVDRGCVPVVCGFQGISRSGHITTLGRGGSDTTACALGVALDADEIEIYTDVDGVMTADPRIVNDAIVLDKIRADELFQLAKMGSKVVHVPAAELALSSGANLFVKNTYSDHAGTRVISISSYRPEASVTSIASTRDVTRFVVELSSGEGTQSHIDAQTAVYEALAQKEISLDMFSPDGDRLALTVASNNTLSASKALSEAGFAFKEMTNLAKVTIVGAGMHGISGVMAKVAGALRGQGIDIYQVADSHTTISVLVLDKKAEDAIRALHYEFYLGE